MRSFSAVAATAGAGTLASDTIRMPDPGIVYVTYEVTGYVSGTFYADLRAGQAGGRWITLWTGPVISSNGHWRSPAIYEPAFDLYSVRLVQATTVDATRSARIWYGGHR